MKTGRCKIVRCLRCTEQMHKNLAASAAAYCRSRFLDTAIPRHACQTKGCTSALRGRGARSVAGQTNTRIKHQSSSCEHRSSCMCSCEGSPAATKQLYHRALTSIEENRPVSALQTNQRAGGGARALLLRLQQRPCQTARFTGWSWNHGAFTI